MTRQNRMEVQFVTFAPSKLESGVLYISMEYATALHSCCCGCGSKVVTPFSPERWSLLFDGRTVTLNPSIGNWSFPCQSHYWIRANTVVWDRAFDPEEIAAVRLSQRSSDETRPSRRRGLRSLWDRFKSTFQ